MNVTTDTFDRLEISAPPNGFASPLASAILLTAAALLKVITQTTNGQPADWPHWAMLALFAGAILLNLREALIRARRRDWVLILDRRAGKVTFIRVRPVRVRPKVIHLSDIESLELSARTRSEAEFRYQPRFALKGGKTWHVPDLWGDRQRIPQIVVMVNRWLDAGAAPEPAEPAAELQSA